jgi:hypothetical protein
MRSRHLTSPLAILPLAALCSCAQKSPYYTEAQALESMRRTTAEADAREAGEPSPVTEPPSLLTVILKHHQDATLEETAHRLDAANFWKTFPPEGLEIESWNFVTGVGQIVTLRVPPDRLTEVARTFDATDWGAYRAEFYATYDLEPIAQQHRAIAPAPSK